MASSTIKEVLPVEVLDRKLDAAIKAMDMPAKPKELYDPARYMLSLGGKRLRPLLVLISCDMLGGGCG